MATIYFGIAGEGRGHAARARTLVELLRRDHRIRIFASGHAYDLLAPLYGAPECSDSVSLRELPFIGFHYDDRARLDYVQTFFQNLPYLFDLPALVEAVAEDMYADPPDLVITDFDPVLPRAANLAGYPYISLDHQHFLTYCDFSALPPTLRAYAAFMAPFVSSFHEGQLHSLVSSFFRAPLKPHVRNVTQIGVLLRPAIIEQQPRDNGHLLAYIRRQPNEQVLRVLSRSPKEVRLYGLGAQPDVGAIRFFDIDPFTFVDDLAGCSALVTTAGNQLVGEAQYLEKPVLAMPEPGNFEQGINAHFLKRSRRGQAVEMEEFTLPHLHTFLEQREHMRAQIDRREIDGNSAALSWIEYFLSSQSRPVAA